MTPDPMSCYAPSHGHLASLSSVAVAPPRLPPPPCDALRGTTLATDEVERHGLSVDQKPEGLDGEFARRVIKLMAAVNVAVYQLTRGRVGGTWRIGAGWRNPVPICLLEHRGRRTGKLRTTPLVYLRDGDRVVVVASQAGRPQHPLWFRNLEADPDVTVQIRGDRRADARPHRASA